MVHDLPALAKMLASPEAAERLRAIRLMGERITAGGRPGDYLGLALPLIGDADHDCRWQALIVVCESIPSDPEAVWRAVCEHGVSDDEDMRDGVATVLLEHLLEHHFDAYFPRLKEKIEGRCRDVAGHAEPLLGVRTGHLPVARGHRPDPTG
jgi:hypothetical protein